MNKEIPIEQLKDLKLLVLDSDGVCIPRGTRIVQTEEGDDFKVSFSTKIIEDRLAKKINRLKKKLIICVSSGRSMIYLQAMYSKILGGETILMAENGALTLRCGVLKRLTYLPVEELLAKIREDVKKLPILGFEPKQFILTVHCDTELKEVYDIVKKHDKFNALKVMWNGEAFDIQDKEMSKGDGLMKILKLLKLSPENVVAIGDRINDKELVGIAGIGVSADKDSLPASYWVEGEQLGGEILVDYLISKLL